MSHIETTRVSDLISLQIGAIQEYAQELNEGLELQQIEAILGSLEGAVAALRETLKAIPHVPGESALEE